MIKKLQNFLGMEENQILMTSVITKNEIFSISHKKYTPLFKNLGFIVLNNNN